MLASKKVKLGVALAALLALLYASGCSFGVSTRHRPHGHPHKPGPPPHAKAHGYRARHTYRYYPGSCVYFDVHRGVYFYLEGGTWRTCASLPATIVIHTHEAVTIELETDRPYIHFDEHKAKYPPGQAKGKGGKGGKGKGQGR